MLTPHKKLGTTTVTLTAAPNLLACANEFLRARGMEPHPTFLVTRSIDKNFAKDVAAAYDAASHAPNDPDVRAAYTALRAEVCEQFEHLAASGFEVELWFGAGEPYRENLGTKPSQAMAADARSGHLFIYLGGEFPTDHLLGGKSGFEIGGHALNFNDVFRAVHDYFGHALYGNEFGPLGEEQAWLVHTRMFSPTATLALATETRGQNCWMNFGPNAHLPASKRPYAEQKNFILPAHLRSLEVSSTIRLSGQSWCALA